MKRPVTSPSNFFRRVLCSGSESAELGSPDGGITAPAVKGTLLHAVDAGEEIELTDISDIELQEKNKALRDRFIERQTAAMWIPQTAKRTILKEIRFPLLDFNGDPVIGVDGLPISGQPDHIEWFPDYKTLFIFDSKFGRVPVPKAINNWQLKLYAIMSAGDFAEFELAEKVIAAITQPLADVPIHGVRYSRDAIATAKNDVFRVLSNCKTQNAERNPSIEACFHCKALATCKKANHVKEILQIKISEIPIPELEGMYDKIKMIEQICAAYYERIRFIMDKCPHLIKTLKIDKGRTIRSIPRDNLLKVCQILTDKKLLTSTQFTTACDVSITAIESIIAKNLKINSAQAKDAISSCLGELMVLKPQIGRLVKVPNKTDELEDS